MVLCSDCWHNIGKHHWSWLWQAPRSPAVTVTSTATTGGAQGWDSLFQPDQCCPCSTKWEVLSCGTLHSSGITGAPGHH